MRNPSVILDPDSLKLGEDTFSVPDPDGSQRIVKLNEKRRRYTEGRADGMSIEAAQKYAGFKVRKVNGKILEQKPEIARAIALKKAEVADELKMTRMEVLAGFLEAIDIGKTQADAHAMIKGWAEIGKMCGFYAPEVKKIDISGSAKRLLDKMEQMTDAELLRLAERTFEGEAAKDIGGGPALPGETEAPT